MSRLDELTAEAHSADDTIHARIHGRTDVTFWMSPGSYQTATSARLGSQLAGLARLLFVARMRAYYAVRSADFGRTVTKEAPMIGRLDEEYARARSELTVSGTDATGQIVLTSTGMTAWAAEVAPDVLTSMDDQEFCAAVGDAATSLVREQFAAIRALKTSVYA